MPGIALIRLQIACNCGIDNGVLLVLVDGRLVMASTANCCEAFGVAEVLEEGDDAAIANKKFRVPVSILDNGPRVGREKRSFPHVFSLVMAYPGV